MLKVVSGMLKPLVRHAVHHDVVRIRPVMLRPLYAMYVAIS